MEIWHVYAGVAVTDFEAGCAWYKRLFGRAPDVVPQQEEAVWHLVGSGSVYVIADHARAGSAVVTLDVVSVEDCLAQLAVRGLRPQEGDAGPTTMKATLSDPDGNRIILFKALSKPTRAHLDE